MEVGVWAASEDDGPAEGGGRGAGVTVATVSCLGVASVLRGISRRFCNWWMTPSLWKKSVKISGSFCRRTSAICMATTTRR